MNAIASKLLILMPYATASKFTCVHLILEITISFAVAHLGTIGTRRHGPGYIGELKKA